MGYTNWFGWWVTGISEHLMLIASLLMFMLMLGPFLQMAIEHRQRFTL